MKKAGILFPHQLFQDHPMLKEVDELYLVEEQLFFKQVSFHKQKIAFHRATMSAFARELKSAKKKIHRISSTDPASDIRQLIEMLAGERQVDELHFIDPTDDWLDRRIKRGAEHFGIPVIFHDSPLLEK